MFRLIFAGPNASVIALFVAGAILGSAVSLLVLWVSGLAWDSSDGSRDFELDIAFALGRLPADCPPSACDDDLLSSDSLESAAVSNCFGRAAVDGTDLSAREIDDFFAYEAERVTGDAWVVEFKCFYDAQNGMAQTHSFVWLFSPTTRVALPASIAAEIISPD